MRGWSNSTPQNPYDHRPNVPKHGAFRCCLVLRSAQTRLTSKPNLRPYIRKLIYPKKLEKVNDFGFNSPSLFTLFLLQTTDFVAHAFMSKLVTNFSGSGIGEPDREKQQMFLASVGKFNHLTT